MKVLQHLQQRSRRLAEMPMNQLQVLNIALCRLLRVGKPVEKHGGTNNDITSLERATDKVEPVLRLVLYELKGLANLLHLLL